MGTCHFWLHIGLQGWIVFWRLTQSRGRRIYNRFDCIFDGLGPKFLRFLDISLLLTFLFRGFGFSTTNSISPEQYFSRKGEKLHQSPSEGGGVIIPTTWYIYPSHWTPVNSTKISKFLKSRYCRRIEMWRMQY